MHTRPDPGPEEAAPADRFRPGALEIRPLRGGFHFTDWFQVEAEDVSMATSETVAGTDIDTSVAAFFLNGVINFHPGKGSVVPFVLGGVGITTIREKLSPGGKLDDTGGASQISAGSRFFFGRNKRVALRLEASVMRHKTSHLIIASQTLKEKRLTVGLTWRIGGER